MIQITAEEIEIIVTASVEEALTEFKKMLPEIKNQLRQVENQFSNVNFKGIVDKTKVAIGGVKQKINEVKNSGVDKTLQSQFDKAGTSVERYQQQLDETQEKLKQVYAQMDQKQADAWKSYTPEGVQQGDQSIEPLVNKSLASDKSYKNLVIEEEKLNQKVIELNQKLQEAKRNYQSIGAEISQAQSKQSIFTIATEKLKSALGSLKAPVSNFKNSFNKMPNITAKVNANIKQMSTGVKYGIGHVLKYAGALFSLRSIYSLLSSSASSWLSSQNAGAQQLQANINYMKYAMGSALAPVIQWITNLVYNLLKAIQSVIYALFKVNIFANASAKSYGAMAKGAKKSKEETKQLAGIHDEINNIQKNDSNSGDSGSGGSPSPSFDLSKVNPTNSIMDAISNGDWYAVGALLGQKLNEAMESIPWDSIQNTARKIGRNIAFFLNGFIETVNWYQVGNTIAQGLNTAIYFAYEFITNFNWKKFGSSIAESINGFFDNMDWKALGQTISAGFIGIFNTITGFFQTLDWGIIVDSIIEYFQGYDYSGVSDAFFEMLGSAVASLVKLGMVIGEKIGEAIDGAREYFQNKIEECGGNVVEGILKGILDAIIGIGQWIVDHIFKPFIDGFKGAFGIHSPSTVMAEMGKYIIEGLFNGILSLVNKITEIWNNMKETAITIFTNVKQKLSEICENIKTKTTELFTKMKENVIERFTNIKTKAQEIWNNIKTNIINKVTNIKEGISSQFRTAYDNIKSIFNNIGNFFTGIWRKSTKYI